MPRRSRRRPSRSRGEGRAWAAGLLLSAVALAGLAGLGYVWATAPAPAALDAATLCPAAGPRSVTVVLLDPSDPLPDVAAREVSTRLGDIADAVPPQGLLEVRVLDPAEPGGRVAFSRCNPGDGTGVSAVTGNPALLRRRWLEGFHAPLAAALSGALAPPAATRWSPIMAAIQRVGVDRFAGRAREGVPKSLVVVSDMVENDPDYTQYGNAAPDFARFRALPAYLKLRPDLAGAEVRVLLVNRLKGPDPGRLVRFWEAWVADGNGRLVEAQRLQGAS